MTVLVCFSFTITKQPPHHLMLHSVCWIVVIVHKIMYEYLTRGMVMAPFYVIVCPIICFEVSGTTPAHQLSSTQVAPYPHFNICLCLHFASFAISTQSSCCTNITQLSARPLKCTWHWRFSLLEYQHVFALQKTRKQALKRCPNWWNFTTKGIICGIFQLSMLLGLPP